VKTPVIYHDDYIVFLEIDFGFTFIHCDCVKWTKEVKRDLLSDLRKLFEIHRSIVGFKYLKDFVGSDAKLRQIFVRRI